MGKKYGVQLHDKMNAEMMLKEDTESGFLTPREKRIFQLRAQSRTLAEVGEALGISRTRVGGIIKRAYERLDGM